MSGPRIFVSAGEVSGDGILGGILELLRARFPDMDVRGLGGSASAASGLKPLFPMERTAFSGAWDVVRNLAFALGMYARAAREMRRFRPDLAVLVDYPGLNLRLARLARNLGVAVCFVAPPQAWAYRNPARKLRRAREALRGCAVHVLFPFERELYADAAAGVTSGHFLGAPAPEPLLARGASGETGKGLLCLCPGSRLPVLRRNLPVWLDCLKASGTEAGGIAVLVPAHLEGEAKRLLAGRSMANRTAITVRTDKAATLAEAAAAIAFPGTLTLELALMRIPTLVLAVLDPLTLALGRRVLGDSRLALPNLFLGEDLFPEWAGTAPGPSVARFRELLDRRDAVDGWEARLERLALRMGPGGGAEAAFQACLALLRAKPVRTLETAG